MSDEFRPAQGATNPLAAGEPALVEDLMWFGLVPGMIINKMRQRKAERAGNTDPLSRLDVMSFRELADLEDSLKSMLDEMEPQEGADPDFVDGYQCHNRLMAWMTEEGERGAAIRHALDDRDGQTLLQFLCPENQARTTDPEFFLGFQAANGELASRFEKQVPRD